MVDNPNAELANLNAALQAVRAVRNSATHYFNTLAEGNKDIEEESDARQLTNELRLNVK